MRSKLLYIPLIILSLTLLLLLRTNNIKEKKFSKLIEDVSSIMANFYLTIENENQLIKKVTLIDATGVNYSLNEILVKHNEPILVAYFPQCICSVEKDKYLNEIEKFHKKGIIKNYIIVFDELDYHKVMALERLNKFSCNLYCNPTSELNLSNNTMNEIFTFYLDSDFQYKNVIFPKMFDSEKLSSLYEIQKK